MKKLGDVLLQKNLVSPENIEKALIIQKKRKVGGELVLLGDILLEQKFIEESVLHSIIREIAPQVSPGKEYGYINSCIQAGIGEDDYKTAMKFHKENEDLNFLQVLDKLDYMKFKSQKRYIVGVMKPFVSDVVVGVPEKFTVRKIEGKLTYFYEEKRVMLGWYPKIGISSHQVVVSREEYEFLTKAETEGAKDHESKGTFGGELPYSVHDIVADACNRNSSDVHIIPKATGYYVYFRIDGVLELQRKYTLDIDRGRSLVFAFKNIAANSSFGGFVSDDKRSVKDGRMQLDETCGGVDARIVLLPDGRLHDEELVARIIRKTTLEQIPLNVQGYFDEDIKIIEKAFHRKSGLFLTSGETGSGKTTFNAQLLLRDTTRKIETIEDPIEYTLPNTNICQHQIYIPKEGPKVGFTELVKGFKRGDPDLILVGEIRRDPALLLSVIEAANAGQLVMSTVHIRSAFEIYRAMQEIFGIDYYTMASLILYSHNQSLVRCLCDKCRIEDKDKTNYKTLIEFKDDFPYIVKDELENFLANPFKTYLHNPSGCDHCGGKGYKGRTPIYEYFYPNVKFVKWLLEKVPTRYEIEENACSGHERNGVNKLQIYMRKLKEGVVDANINTIKELM